MHHAIRRKREAKGPPAELNHLRASNLAAVAAAANAEIGTVGLVLAIVAAVETDKHPRPIFLQAPIPFIGMIFAGDRGVRVAASAKSK